MLRSVRGVSIRALDAIAMNTNELAQRLDAEGFNPTYYCIGPGWRRLGDGHALDRVGNSYEWFYVERGEKRHVEGVFTSEEEACQFAYEALSNNKSAQSHMVGMFETESEALDLVRRLSLAGIESETDRIPYGGPDDPRFRVFVYGRDVFNVGHIVG
jgi:hypothetical protein